VGARGLWIRRRESVAQQPLAVRGDEVAIMDCSQCYQNSPALDGRGAVKQGDFSLSKQLDRGRGVQAILARRSEPAAQDTRRRCWFAALEMQRCDGGRCFVPPLDTA
jgi:hypothetical protein